MAGHGLFGLVDSRKGIEHVASGVCALQWREVLLIQHWRRRTRALHLEAGGNQYWELVR